MSSDVYPRGFLLSRQTTNPPAGFVTAPFFDNFFVDAVSSVDFASDGEACVVVLGTCVSIKPETAGSVSGGNSATADQDACGSSPLSPAQQMLRALLLRETDFFDLIDNFCGRHAIVFGTRTNPLILTDATGMRTVFYASEGGVVASHALLVEETLGGEIRRKDLPFRYGFPGNHTPYIRTRLLTPNTFYDVAQAKVVRFWPRRKIEPRTAKEAADLVLSCTTTALKRVAPGKRLSLSVTAGIDSRTTLALAVHSGVLFDGYTYDRGKNTLIDCAVGRELARIAGIEHHLVRVPDPPSTPEELKRRLNRATYYGHHHTVVAPMQRHFGGADVLAVTANLLEIGRFFYKGKEYQAVRPETPEAMCEFALIATGLSAQQMAERYGPEPKRLATECFSDFVNATDFNAARGFIDSRDQFYWEYKMSAWHGMILLERDFYADCFIPFNSRYIFEALLGVKEWDRKEATVFKLLIKKCAPNLLSSIPVNPEQWPLKRRSVKGFLNDTLQWAKDRWIQAEHRLEENGFGFISRPSRQARNMLDKRHSGTKH
jgi:hypothetical protein